MTIYVDGSAMSRALIDTPESLDWRAWIAEHADELVTTPLGLTELRRVADPLGSDARLAADMIGRRVTVLRFSDQALRVAAMAAGVLSPFAALHLGTAVSHPDITAIATYDPLLARVARLYGVEVITPGRPPGWWET